MLEGGFVVFENLKPWEETSPAEMSLKQFVRDTFGSRARIAIIPNDHPLYHCFFNFPDGPPIGSEYKIINGRVYFGTYLISKESGSGTASPEFFRTRDTVFYGTNPIKATLP